jgi:UDP-N-acetylmuramyl pentapeptide phosphotransferase/UDP-N-acetylglucosamine-1-phosphate transferase
VSQGASIWVVLLLALMAASLPFLSDRVLGLVPLRSKTLAVRFAELVLLYFVVGGVGLLFEKRAGQIAPQGWEFYAVTGALFIVLAFPGFTWRYLVKHR